MRTALALLAPLPLLLALACGDKADDDTGGDTAADADTDGDTDGDADTDGDTDGDADTDGDTDSDTDTDTDTDSDTDTDTPVDADGDGFLDDEDCDDADPSVYPGAPELADGVDSDCDGDASDAGLVTWWDADGTATDATADVQGGSWTAPGDGRLGIGAGTWALVAAVPAGLDVQITGAEGTLIENPGEACFRTDGTLHIADLEADCRRLITGVDATLTLERVDLGGTRVEVYQGAHATLRGVTAEHTDSAIVGVLQSGTPDADSRVTIEDSAITGGQYMINGVEIVEVSGSTLTGTGAYGPLVHMAPAVTIADSTLTATADGLELREGWSVSLVDTDVQAGNRGVYSATEGGVLGVSGGSVHGDAGALEARGLTATLADTTLGATTGWTVWMTGSSSFPSALDAERIVATSGADGLLSSNSTSTFRILDSTLSGGGTARGIAVMNLSSTATNRLEGSTLSDFVSPDDGAAYASTRHHGTVEIVDCSFADNSAGGSGGALHLDRGTLDLRGATFTDNAAVARGGALSIDSGAAATLVDITAHRNSAGVAGGAINTGAALAISGAWDFGTGADDNTSEDVFLLNHGSTWSLDAGTGAFTCGGSSDACSP